MTAIKVNYAERKIVLSSAFVKKCFTPGSVEYAQLQSVRSDYPDFALVTRKFKTNTAQEHYRGLTYDFMREYIETKEDAKTVLVEFERIQKLTKFQNASYVFVKKWFLGLYGDEFKREEEDERETA